MSPRLAAGRMESSLALQQQLQLLQEQQKAGQVLQAHHQAHLHMAGLLQPQLAPVSLAVSQQQQQGLAPQRPSSGLSHRRAPLESRRSSGSGSLHNPVHKVNKVRVELI